MHGHIQLHSIDTWFSLFFSSFFFFRLNIDKLPGICSILFLEQMKCVVFKIGERTTKKKQNCTIWILQFMWANQKINDDKTQEYFTEEKKIRLCWLLVRVREIIYFDFETQRKTAETKLNKKQLHKKTVFVK